MANRVKMFLLRSLRELTAIRLDRLVQNRYEKFRRMGVYLESAIAPGDVTSDESSPAPV